MGSLIGLIASVFAATWLFDHEKGRFWWVLLITLSANAILMAIVLMGTPNEPLRSSRAFDALASPAARALLMPAAILNLVLIGMVVYAYWIR